MFPSGVPLLALSLATRTKVSIHSRIAMCSKVDLSVLQALEFDRVDTIRVLLCLEILYLVYDCSKQNKKRLSEEK